MSGAATAIVLVGVVAYGASASSTSAPELDGTPPGPGHLAHAYGLDPRSASSIVTLGNGDSVGVVTSATARCLIRTRQEQIDNEACVDVDQLTSTRGITVTDECGAAGHRLMEITGLAPDDATTARLLWTNGTAETTAVQEGLFAFEGTNPQPGEPYPTTVEWLGAATVIGRAALPVVDGNFCLPSE